MNGADRSARGILAANVLTVAVALWQGWGLLQLLWPFWIQSVIIGWYARRRMLVLQDFCTDGLKINNRAVDATPETLRRTANFFAVHYGFFHFGYLVFLLGFAAGADVDGRVPVTNESTGQVHMLMVGQVHPLDFLIFLALGVGFWFGHRASHREHVRRDLEGRPSLGKLMFIPYLRVFPMHLTIIFGGLLGGGAVLLFGCLKTVADLLMHRVEHRMLQTESVEKAPVRSE